MATTPPTGTKAGGRKLWNEVTSTYALEAHETALLVEVVRTIDLLDDLNRVVRLHGSPMLDDTRTHPALAEIARHRIGLARILAALRLPDGIEGDESAGRHPRRRVGARGVYKLGSTG